MSMPDLLLAACSGANPKAEAGHRDGWVSLYRFGEDRMAAAEIARTEVVSSPSFLAWSERHAMLYVASELAEGDGRVTALTVAKSCFEARNHVSTGGHAAVHLCLDRQDNHIFVANYQAEDRPNQVSVGAFALAADGTLGAMSGATEHHGKGPDKSRQERPHCHSVMVSPDNRLVAAADLGTDSLYLYTFDATAGSISLGKQLMLPPGSGPRHSVFHPTRPFAYVAGELDSTLVTVAIDTVSSEAHVVESVAATGEKVETRNYPSGIVISPDGHYVLIANRGADTIAVFWIDPETGIARLRSEVACGGRFPRAIRFDPSARYLAVANQHSDDITIFSWDFSKGALSQAPIARIEIPTPLDMIFVR
jgi:6-phosphogluconolactonase